MSIWALRRHTEDFKRQYVLNTYCDNSDGATFCACQRDFGDREACMFYGRNLEPLAFSIDAEAIDAQDECTLLTRLPREIRQMIWEYALTDTNSFSAFNKFRWRADHADNVPKFPTLDVAFDLLQSCKAIYMETYRLPLQLNSYTVLGFHGPFRPDLKTLAPWQAALIQRLDVRLTQMAVERGELRNWLTHWWAKKRHDGALIKPYFKCVMDKSTGYHLRPFPFELLGTPPGEKQPGDEEYVTLPVPPGASEMLYNKAEGLDRTHFSARAMVARPLTHLTLRLCHEDWWTWSDDPARTDPPPGHLSLDPAIGLVDGSKWHTCSVKLMQDLAAKRRAGEDVQGHGTWGAIVGRLPDLKELTLVLETFDSKLDQLESVVECAKTWRFPIEGTPFELVWDGDVGDASWEKDRGSEDDNQDPDIVESESDASSVFQLTESEGEEDNEEEDNEEEDNEEEDSEGDSEDEVEQEEEDTPEHQREVTVVRRRAVPWNELCKGFEVRVVRFVRRTVERSTI